MPRVVPFSLLVALVAVACGHPQPGRPAVSPQPGGTHNLLTSSEFHGATERNLYEVIQRQRPTFLRSRQVRSPSTPNPEPVHVYIDGTRAEGLDALKLIAPSMVREVRFYEPQDANIRFGTGHHGGLIAVTLER